MPLTTNKEFSRRYIEELQNAKNLDVIDEMMTEDCQIHFGSKCLNREQYKNTVETLQKHFPDIHVIIKNQIAEGDIVVTQWRTYFTHSHKMMGKEPTYEHINIGGASIYKIVGNTILEVWIYWDRQDIMKQIGVTYG